MDSTDLKKWQTNSSKYLVNDRWLKLRADSCTTPDGHIIEPYYVFEYPDWVTCFVVDDNKDVIMVKHYRHGAGEYIPELVSGILEKEDSSPEEGIRRELEEEIGYIDGEIYQTGVSYVNPATHTNKVHSFIAIGGGCTGEQKLGKGENLYIMKIPLREFLKAIENEESGIIYQSIHLASIFFALKFMEHSSDDLVKSLRR